MQGQEEQSYPRFWVTYATQNSDAGANPFGHGFLFFSTQDSKLSPIQVINAFGFYGEYRSSSTTNPITRGLKHLLGFKMDLQDSHGHLEQENMRYLDGLGIFGTSFCITAAQYQSLAELYKMAHKNEQTAIVELNMRLMHGYEMHLINPDTVIKKDCIYVEVTDNLLTYRVIGPSGNLETGTIATTELNLKTTTTPTLSDLRKILPSLLKKTTASGHTLTQGGRKANGHTRYVEELRLAEEENRQPRLKPFHVTMKITAHGFDTSQSYTCKNYALDMLMKAEIITPALYSKLLGSKFEHAFPRFGSNDRRPWIQLVATGEPQAHSSRRSNKVHYSRSWGKNQLFWTAQPLIFHQQTPPSANAKLLHNITTNEYLNHYLQIKVLLSRTRHIERLLLIKLSQFDNEKKIHNQHYHQLSIQIKRVQNIYNLFKGYNNQGHFSIHGRIEQAESILNIAQLTLTPEKAHYSFLLRAYESVLLKKMLLGLLTIAISAAILTGAVGIIITVASTLYTTYKLYQFIGNEIEGAKIRADYWNYQSQLSATEPDLAKSPTEILLA